MPAPAREPVDQPGPYQHRAALRDGRGVRPRPGEHQRDDGQRPEASTRAKGSRSSTATSWNSGRSGSPSRSPPAAVPGVAVPGARGRPARGRSRPPRTDPGGRGPPSRPRRPPAAAAVEEPRPARRAGPCPVEPDPLAEFQFSVAVQPGHNVRLVKPAGLPTALMSALAALNGQFPQGWGLVGQFLQGLLAQGSRGRPGRDGGRRPGAAGRPGVAPGPGAPTGRRAAGRPGSPRARGRSRATERRSPRARSCDRPVQVAKATARPGPWRASPLRGCPFPPAVPVGPVGPTDQQIEILLKDLPELKKRARAARRRASTEARLPGRGTPVDPAGTGDLPQEPARRSRRGHGVGCQGGRGRGRGIRKGI